VAEKEFTGKVLFLGNNDETTDQTVSVLAQESNTVNYGLVTDPHFVPENTGYYHTSVVDISWGELLKVAQEFDTVVMLDQPQSQWSHWKCFQSTFKLMQTLQELGQHTIFQENKNVKKLQYWSNLVFNENKSFCIYPWINYHQQGKNLHLCSRSPVAVTTADKLESWATDTAFSQIRSKMLLGEQLPDHCSLCYDQYEKQGVESYRQFETIDWVTKLEIESVDDLYKIQHPHFYEVHSGNHCNIKCRGCEPRFSAPIGREIKKFNIVVPSQMAELSSNLNTPNIDYIDIDTLHEKTSVYFQGGEPTIMPEVLNFLKQCIEKNKTDFFLTMCTNGVKISEEFLQVVSHFSNTNFSFSLDGYSKINDYWRSGSQWDKVIDNLRLLKSQGHSISINTVPGIYNVTNLHLLFEFLDREFPFTAVYLQLNHLPWQSAFNHPLKELVVESMLRCMQTSIYHSNGKSCKSAIDSIYTYYSNNPECNLKDLKDLFDYNDQLDRARGTKLAYYIPELELARNYIK
jgi:sulfatase maturation enzyme AslB (radical SAM superfamily)